jgi:ribosomal protein S12 methylthiotransferase
MGVFPYSDVETAASHALGAKVDAKAIADRRDRLMALQRKISARRLRRFVGQTLSALVEGPSPASAGGQSDGSQFVWEARLPGMAPEIDGKLYLTDLEPPSGGAPARPGDIAMVEITASHDYDLVGRVTEICESVSKAPAELPGFSLRQIPTGTPLRILA